MAHAQVSVEHYGGTEKEDFSEFELLFQGYIGVAAITNAQQANFLQLHLRDNALRFYQTLGPATRASERSRESHSSQGSLLQPSASRSPCFEARTTAIQPKNRYSREFPRELDKENAASVSNTRFARCRPN